MLTSEYFLPGALILIVVLIQEHFFLNRLLDLTQSITKRVWGKCSFYAPSEELLLVNIILSYEGSFLHLQKEAFTV